MYDVLTPQIPGSYGDLSSGDDFEFAATLRAGLKAAGFDDNIVIEDAEYRRRDSPPGSNDELGPGTTSKSSPVLDREPVADERGSMFRGEKKKKKKSRRKQAEDLLPQASFSDVASASHTGRFGDIGLMKREDLLPQASSSDVASASYTGRFGDIGLMKREDLLPQASSSDVMSASYTGRFGDIELMKREPNIGWVDSSSLTNSGPGNSSTVQASGDLANMGYVQTHHLHRSQQHQYVKKPNLSGNQQNISGGGRRSAQRFSRWGPPAPSAAKPVLTDSRQTSMESMSSAPPDKAAMLLARLGRALGPTSYDRYDRIRSGGVATAPQNSGHTTTKSPGRDQGSHQRAGQTLWPHSPGSKEDFTKARTLDHGPEEQKPRRKATDEVLDRFWDFTDTSLAEEERKYRLSLSDSLGKSGPNKQQATDDAMEERPTHTRMARRHVSLETLRTFDIEHTIDEEVCSHVLLEVVVL